MLQVKRRDKESTASLIRRFTIRVRQSGILEQVRSKMFYQHSKSKLQLKKEALYKEDMRKKYDKLRKLGKLDDTANKK